MALETQLIQIPLVGGVNTGQDPRALQPPALAECVDAEFDNVGGLQPRKPFEALSTKIYPLGITDIADPRRIVANGDELLLFTKDTLYTWNAAASQWVDKGTHLAIAIDEQERFVTTDEQIQCDRAELNGTIVYTWSAGEDIFIAAIDKETGSVIMPTSANDLPGCTRPRVVATQTAILFFYINDPTGAGQLRVWSIDPAAPALNGISVLVYDPGLPGDDQPSLYYDVVKRANGDEAFVAVTHFTTTAHSVFRVTGAATPVVTGGSKARSCTGPIAVATSESGSNINVVRTTTTGAFPDHVKADCLSLAFADVAVNAAIGSSTGEIMQVTADERLDTASGFQRLSIFWCEIVNTISSDWEMTLGSVVHMSGGTPTVGSQASIARRLYVCSRAFRRDGYVYVHGSFGGRQGIFDESPQLQNTNFLYRDDGRLCGKSIVTNAGAFKTSPATEILFFEYRGHLPGVAPIGDDVYAWCGTDRRALPVGDGSDKGYAARAPIDVLISFDDDRARRCVRFGNTLYVTGAEILQWDGSNLVEVGFHIYPWFLVFSTLSSGSLANGTYSYKGTYRWDNAMGERERSTTATYTDVVVSGGPKSAVFSRIPTLEYTHKSDASTPIAVEVWRTKVDAGIDAPFYCTTSRDPGDTTGDNLYLANDLGQPYLTYEDGLADSELATHEQNDEVGTILENLAPPPAQIIIATQDRLFLAGIAGDPDRVWYSKQRPDGWIASFNDALTIPIPPTGGAITGLAILSETLVVFREHAVYVVPGDGFANDGSGSNYGPARIVSIDCGAESHEAIARTDMGLVFKSAKGMYLLSSGWQIQYIGEAVKGFDEESILSMSVIEAKQQVRCLTAYRMLVWDYLVNQWSEWSIANGVSACMWGSTHVYLDTTTAYTELPRFDRSVTYGLDVETPWIKLADLQGRGRVRRILVLGEFRTPHRVRVRVARDYQETERIVNAGTDVSFFVTTDATRWNAIISAEKAVGISIGVDSASTSIEDRAIEVRYGYTFSAGGGWSLLADFIGIRLGTATGGDFLCTELEAAIEASGLARIIQIDSNPGALLDSATIEADNPAGTLTGGVTWFDDQLWTADATVVGSAEQFRIGPSIQRCQAIKIRLSASATTGSGADLTERGECFRLTGLGLEIGIEQGLNRGLALAQKV